MKQVNINVAKANLSGLIQKAMLGEEIIIAKGNYSAQDRNGHIGPISLLKICEKVLTYSCMLRFFHKFLGATLTKSGLCASFNQGAE